eukprot:2796704-Pyramimonas_sp.AAC.2
MPPQGNAILMGPISRGCERANSWSMYVLAGKYSAERISSCCDGVDAGEDVSGEKVAGEEVAGEHCSTSFGGVLVPQSAS